VRLVNRVLALLLALALALGGLLLAVEVAAAGFHKQPVLARWHGLYAAGTRDSWESGPVRAVVIVAVALGLLLLAAQLKRRRPGRLPVVSGEPAVDAAVTRAGVRTAVRRAAMEVDGISRAKVKVRRRRVKVRAVSRLGDQEAARGLQDEVASRVGGRLDELQLSRPLGVRARVAPRRNARNG